MMPSFSPRSTCAGAHSCLMRSCTQLRCALRCALMRDLYNARPELCTAGRLGVTVCAPWIVCAGTRVRPHITNPDAHNPQAAHSSQRGKQGMRAGGMKSRRGSSTAGLHCCRQVLLHQYGCTCAVTGDKGVHRVFQAFRRRAT